MLPVFLCGSSNAALEETTLATVLKRAGYRTATMGKWGVGPPPPLDDPNQHGFDHFHGYVNMFQAHNFYPSFLVRKGKKEVLGNTQIEAFRENPPDKEGRGVTVKKRICAGIDYPRCLAVYRRASRRPFLPLFRFEHPPR